MKKKTNKSINSFDQMVDNLIIEFSKIPNFDLTTKDELANKMFKIVTFRIADLSSYKSLVINHYIPATNKAITSTENQLLHSKYRALINISKEDLKETLYQTIRLSYVGLFHKFESFINDIILVAGMFVTNNSESIDKYAKRKFEFDIKDWFSNQITYKINWICNCVKHYDGYPIKTPKPRSCEHYLETARLKLSSEDFKFDAELLIKYCTIYMQMMFLIAIFKEHVEDYDRNFWKDSPEILKIHDEGAEKQTKIIKEAIIKMKALSN